MKLLFGGCSHTYGDELNPETRERERYSHIVSEHFGAEEINVSSNGKSIPATIYTLYEKIKIIPDIDLCIFQITYTDRLYFPILSDCHNISTTQTSYKSYANQMIMLLSKLISTSNGYKTGDNFWRIHCPQLNMFEDSCQLRNIKTLYFCTEHKQRSSVLKRCLNLDIIDVGLIDYVFDNNLPFGRLHPLAGAHEAFAKNILIPEIEKRL